MSETLMGQYNPLLAQLEGAAAMGSACSHLVLQSLVAQSAKVIEKIDTANASLRAALQKRDQEVAELRNDLTAARLERNALKNNLDSATRWPAASVHPGPRCICNECQNRFPSATPQEAYARISVAPRETINKPEFPKRCWVWMSPYDKDIDGQSLLLVTRKKPAVALDCIEYLRAHPVEHETSNPLLDHCFAVSEPYLRGYRLVLGFETLEQVQEAHKYIAELAYKAQRLHASAKSKS
jgi:hypothetical protein